MKYRRLGRTGLKVPEIGLGTMMFGEKTEEAEAVRMVHRALDAGAFLIDVADVYADGESERMVGKALRDRRAQALLATKVGRPTALGQGLSRRYVFQALEASLDRLQNDYVDLYQVHWWDPECDVAETLSALTDLVRQGKVRYIGCSNWAAWQLCKALWVSDVRHLALCIVARKTKIHPANRVHGQFDGCPHCRAGKEPPQQNTSGVGVSVRFPPALPALFPQTCH